tara:strand:+ start:104 stop:946 length:843 start_codon:yes stop_codon:yes gene_type:complete
MRKFIAGGCSFTFGHELSDDFDGKEPSRKSWAFGLNLETRKPSPTLNYLIKHDYICTASPGSGNSGIARRVFNAVSQHANKEKDEDDIFCVVVMWSFKSRYDWAMPRHRSLENTRWASISPWDTTIADNERHQALSGSEVQQEHWKHRQRAMLESGVKPFAEAIYRNAANDYHETYLSWKSIIWLQNILEKKKIPFMFTLADNSLFYDNFDHLKDQDPFMSALHSEIDLTKWFSFGERMMGFNQWSLIEEYERGTTHPLDEAHKDAVQLMLPTFKKLIGE